VRELEYYGWYSGLENIFISCRCFLNFSNQLETAINMNYSAFYDSSPSFQTKSMNYPPDSVCPMDLFPKPVNFAPEEIPSFNILEPNYAFDNDSQSTLTGDETDFDALSDVDSEYEVNYVRHKSKLGEENFEDDELSEDEHYLPHYLSPVAIQQGKNVGLVKRHHVRNARPRDLDQFEIQVVTPAYSPEEEPLSPTSCYVCTEEIGPVDDYPSPGHSPDLGDLTDDDTTSDTTLDTLVEHSSFSEDLWFQRKPNEMHET
jgi:hypothetical protein